jgi:hypothetical protein
MTAKIARQVAESPSLGPVTRSGQPGICLVCHQPVTAHVDSRGQWLGCKAGVRGKPVTLLLVPARRRTDAELLERVSGTLALKATPAATGTASEGHKTQSSSKPSPDHVANPVGRPAVAYVAKLPVTHNKVKALSSERDREVYGVIRKLRHATRAGLIKQLNAEERTGIVDGAVRRLRLAKLITVEAA